MRLSINEYWCTKQRREDFVGFKLLLELKYKSNNAKCRRVVLKYSIFLPLLEDDKNRNLY